MENPPPLAPSSGEGKKSFLQQHEGTLFVLFYFLFHLLNVIPQDPAFGKCSLDDGWIRVLNWAFANPSFTPELIFTYGPPESLLVPLTLTSFPGGVLLSLGSALLLKDLFHFKTKREAFILGRFALKNKIKLTFYMGKKP